MTMLPDKSVQSSGHIASMRMLPFILALFAVISIMAHGWLGPIYTMYDWCDCHRSRTWLEFNECASLRRTQFFLRIEQPGDLQHEHRFCDPQYERQIPIFVYAGVGFGVLSAASWIYQRKRMSVIVSRR